MGRQSVNVAMEPQGLTESVESLARLTPAELRALWRQWFNGPPPARLRQALLVRALAYRLQERQQGGLRVATRKQLRVLAELGKTTSIPKAVEPPRLTPGTHVIREWKKERHHVTVESAGFVYRGQRYRSLSEIARRITGTRWSGPVFFGVKPAVQKSLARREEKG